MPVSRRMGRGAGLLHPAALTAVVLLVVNDHLLKAAFPGVVTGKLSDFAGMAFFPLFLQAGLEWLGAPVSRRLLAAACVSTAGVFAAVKTLPVAHALYENGLGWLQAPIRVLLGLRPGPVALEMDPTDLLALPAVAIAWWVGRDRDVVIGEVGGGRPRADEREGA